MPLSKDGVLAKADRQPQKMLFTTETQRRQRENSDLDGAPLDPIGECIGYASAGNAVLA